MDFPGVALPPEKNSTLSLVRSLISFRVQTPVFDDEVRHSTHFHATRLQLPNVSSSCVYFSAAEPMTVAAPCEQHFTQLPVCQSARPPARQSISPPPQSISLCPLTSAWMRSCAPPPPIAWQPHPPSSAPGSVLQREDDVGLRPLALRLRFRDTYMCQLYVCMYGYKYEYKYI